MQQIPDDQHTTPELQRYRMTLEFDGTAFYGWQVQAEGRTVQGEVERALEIFFGEPIKVQAAGRTDTGVHAYGLVAHFDAPPKHEPGVIEGALNHHLPEDVRVREVRAAGADFHARFSGRWRWYRYQVCAREPVIERFYGWHPEFTFSLETARSCAEMLTGEHDFTAFVRQSPEIDHNRCTIYASTWLEVETGWQFHIAGNRFLHHMVRNLVGGMLDTARGRFTQDDFRGFLEGGVKSGGIYKAPARGLCLMAVGYGSFPFLDADEQVRQTFPFSY